MIISQAGHLARILTEPENFDRILNTRKMSR